LSGPYGIFASDSKAYPGKIGEGSYLRWSGSVWEKIESGKSTNIGIFIGTSE